MDRSWVKFIPRSQSYSQLNFPIFPILIAQDHSHKEWNQHCWKNWKEWQEEFPWVMLEQTGLGCDACSRARVKTSSWSKFRACRGVTRLIICDNFLGFNFIDLQLRLWSDERTWCSMQLPPAIVWQLRNLLQPPRQL